uniref:Uncharacterized protein n=1 Tax=Zea mays TaxID=4577 RepID=A0A804QMB6_MAIZE
LPPQQPTTAPSRLPLFTLHPSLRQTAPPVVRRLRRSKSGSHGAQTSPNSAPFLPQPNQSHRRTLTIDGEPTVEMERVEEVEEAAEAMERVEEVEEGGDPAEAMERRRRPKRGSLYGLRI